MTKTQLAVLKAALKSAEQRASWVDNEEKLWLHTWIIPRLQSVIGNAEGTVSESELRSQENLPLSGEGSRFMWEEGDLEVSPPTKTTPPSDLESPTGQRIPTRSFRKKK